MSYYSFENLVFLLVDDNVKMRKIIRSILDGLGASTVIEADEGVQALALLKSNPVDIVMCDMMMAPMDGITFTRAVRTDAESPNRFLPIIMTSAYSEPDRVVAARDAGVTEFLAKPLSVTAIYRRVMTVIERPRPFVRVDGYFGPARRGIDIVPGEGPPARPTAPKPVAVEMIDG